MGLFVFVGAGVGAFVGAEVVGTFVGDEVGFDGESVGTTSSVGVEVGNVGPV